MPSSIRSCEGKNDAALRIIDPVLEQARREFGRDDPKTLQLAEQARSSLLCRLGDLAEAGSSAEELLASRTSEARPRGPETLSTLLKTLAVIRRDQGRLRRPGTLLARLRSEGQKALAKPKEERLDPDRALRLRRMVAFAEIVARNLSRPERSNAAPGTPGGPPRIDAPYLAKSPVADGRIEPGEYGDGDGLPSTSPRTAIPVGFYIFDETTRSTKDPADLSARIHAAHTSTALFLAVPRARPVRPGRPGGGQGPVPERRRGTIPRRRPGAERQLMPSLVQATARDSSSSPMPSETASAPPPTSATRMEGGHGPHRGRLRDRVRDPAGPDRHPGRSRGSGPRRPARSCG